MKGVVFVALAEMIQKKYGHKAWNDIILKSNLPSMGVFTVAETYEDEEALKLLKTISTKLNKKSEDVLKIFGIYLLYFFHRRYPQFFKLDSFPEFLSSIETTIHSEIKKFSPDCQPPKIHVTTKSEGHLYITYTSERKLCSLAIGLIKGAANVYQTNIELEHTACMHNGNDKCEFNLRIK